MKKQIIGYTAGVYDLFHIGHLTLLKNAKGMCDKLIVGVTVDETAQYKGKRPMIPFEERIEIVRSCQYVDAAVPQYDMDKLSMCKKLGATRLFVGDDWFGTEKWKAYEQEFAAAGIQIVYFPYTRGVSSTRIRDALQYVRGWTLPLNDAEQDKGYCMSSFLMFRKIMDDHKDFSGRKHVLYQDRERTPICDSHQLEAFLKQRVTDICRERKVALALSGGIDSAILAKFMPRGSIAYTFRCLVPGVQVTDESEAARAYAEECGLRHKVVDIYWEDFERYAPVLMTHKNAPIHSIEVQIYKAALQARQDGLDGIIFGENADILYGGMDGLLAKDWLFGEFVERYSYVLPHRVLKRPQLILEPFRKYERDGHIDPHSFVTDVFRLEAMGTYTNAMATAGLEAICPYAETCLAVPIDYRRIRAGDAKYLVREVFRRLYPGREIPKKVPMPRPMDEWFKDWGGPVREEFLPHCTDGMRGDQKWMVWALEKYLDMLEQGDSAFAPDQPEVAP